MGACFALKHQRLCGEKFHPSLVNLEILEELWLQQEIEDTHDNKEAYNTRLVWDSKNCAASTDLIQQHFCQIRGMDSAPCAYLMHKHVVSPTTPAPSNDHAESFNDQMIKQYPIVKTLDLLSNMPTLDMEPSLKFKPIRLQKTMHSAFRS